MLIYEELTHEIRNAATEVHRSLGPGLLESAYEECLCHELSLRRIPHQRQAEVPIEYKGMKLDCGYRIDVLVDNKIVLELKSIDHVAPIHEAQLITYLKLSRMKVGLLMNFNVLLLKDGIKRIVL